MNPVDAFGGSAIAIVGLAGRFPGARDANEFWRNLRAGAESIRALSDAELLSAGADAAWLRDPSYVKAAGVLDDLAMFDAAFFGVSPKDAGIMDPQHRHFLECAVAALEHAGHAPRAFPGSIGVFAGCGMNAYFVNNLLTNPALLRSVGLFLLRHTGNDRDFLPTSVSYKLDLRGPSIAIQTACSTSLVAIHTACQSLLAGECDLALAGGVTILVPHGQGYFYRENEPVSPDGHCRPFDRHAAGTIVSSGCGVVVLRRLSDALESGDSVHAVIRGSAINNDGAGKVGYLAPSVEGHASVVTEALALAGVSADTISYLEAHGTGTPVGDPIEIAALTQAFRQTTERRGFCAIGSVKSNLGHLDTAAGVASLIKVVKALEHRELPPTLHFEAPNPEIDFASSPFHVNAELSPWPRGESPRRAGISSLGIGGTNAHVIVEEAPEPAATDAPQRAWQILPLAAKSQTALDAISDRLATHLREQSDTVLADAAFTLQDGREPWDHRRVVVAQSALEAALALEQRDAARVVSGRREGAGIPVAFLFSGAGAQYPGMGRDLYEAEPVYREAIDRCLSVVQPLIDFDLVRWLYPRPGEEDRARSELEKPSRLCPAIVATEFALAALWRSWGIEPVAMLGHSLGEYTAACLAGVFSLEDALRLVVLRGALVDRLSGGAMLSVSLPEAELRGLLGDELDLAAVNAPALCVVSGRRERVEALAGRLAEREIECRVIPVAAAGHSRELDPILAEYERGLREAKLEAPRLPYVSNVTGSWVRTEDAQSPAYWLRHFRETVRFADGLRELVGDGSRVLLEVGPGQTLLAFARQQPKRPRAAFASLRRSDETISDVALALRTLGGLWSVGAEVPWSRLRGPGRRRRIPLPTYPFEHRAYWIEPGRPLAETPAEAPLERLSDTDAWFRRPAWKRAPLGAAAPSAAARWLVFLDTAGVGLEVTERLRAAGHRVATVRLGDTFYGFGEHEYALAPEAGRVGYDELLKALAENDLLPDRVAHFWSITEDEGFRPGSSFLHRSQECGFWSLFFLAQAFGGGDKLPSRIDVFSTGMQSVAGEPLAHPEKATLLGPVRVVPHELAGVRCRSVDLALPGHARRGRSADALGELVDGVVAELLCESKAEIVAWRGGERFEEAWEPAATPVEGGGKLRLRPNATVLVTGGLGGIGLALSAHLARRHGTRLVLVGRNPLPPEEGRDRWLASHGERDPMSRRLRAVRALEAAGAEVMVADADVADVERMREVVDEARKRFGAIHGVVHAAGAMEDGVIQAKTLESVERVLGPKLHGTRVLARVLADEPLEFFATFSSASALLGPPGQVDYVAANCFLNAFAEHRVTTRGEFSVALGWSVWKEVGGAVALAGRLRGEAPEPGSSRATGHPLLGECVAEGPERWRWVSEYRAAEHWVLDEHRTRTRTALLPGTAYLEIARAAWNDAFGAGPVEIRDLSVLAPLAVDDDAVRALETELVREPEGASFEFRSLGPGGQAHARGHLLPLHAPEPPRLELESIEGGCGGEVRDAGADGALASPQEAQLAFGPRWSCLRRSAFGESEALARLELPERFGADLEHHALHAALLDVATGFGLPLLPGFESGRALFVPMGYERVRVRGRLPARIASRVRSRPGSDAQREVATFDVTLTDASGDVLVEIEGLSFRRLDPDRHFGEVAPAAPGRAGARAVTADTGSPGERLFLETFEMGLSVAEGAAAFERVLSDGRGGALVVSPIDLERWRDRLEKACAAQNEEPAVKFERPELESRYEAARDEVEEKLAACFGELLGVDRVGIHDDFFALGGHSLIAVRLFAKAKKLFGVEYPLSLLFEAPTVAALADRVRADTGTGAGAFASAATRVSKHRFLVPMNQVAETRKLPLFLVAGMFGNVLNLRHLAAHLGKDQPVVAIQARGLYGEDPPHRRFDEMAEDYLREVRMLQPEGPYLLGGFSGGGVTAFEMAHQLIAEGEEIAALILLDAIPPTWPEPSRLDRALIQWQRLRRQGPAYAARWARNRLRWELEKRQPRAARELTPAEFRSSEIEAAFREALAHYAMRVYPGKVSLFRPPLDESHRLSSGRLANARRELVDPQNFWRPWVAGGIDVQVVSGDHDAMVLEPSVRVLAARVRAVLEAAQPSKPDQENA